MIAIDHGSIYYFLGVRKCNQIHVYLVTILVKMYNCFFNHYIRLNQTKVNCAKQKLLKMHFFDFI